MNWTAIILLSALVLQVLGKQSSGNNGVKSKRNSSQRTVRLDPLLRKALLRALTELEKEAQEKIRQEEAERSRSEKKDLGKRGNDLEDLDSSAEEIQNTADTRYPTPSPIVNAPETEPPLDPTTTAFPDVTEPPLPVTIKDAFFFHTPTPIEHEFTSPAVQETKRPDTTLSPPDVESNLISESRFKENLIEATNKPEEITTVRSEVEDLTKTDESEKKKSSDKDTEVELFQAPLVAAFTLHQDSRGTPQSVIPLLGPDPVQTQNFFQQQNFQFRQQQLRQQPQQQFIPSVSISPLSQSNSFNQGQRAFGATSISSSTAFPPLVSNSIIPSNFQSSIVPSQSFTISSTVSPIRNNNNKNNAFVQKSAAFVSSPSPSFSTTPVPFGSSSTPTRNFSPGSTAKPQSEVASDVSIVQSQVFSVPTPSTDLVAPKLHSPAPFEQFNIPPVTLPLQNEPRVPFNFQNNQDFSERPKRVEDQTRQFRFENQNGQRQLGEQNRLRQQPNKAAELRQEGFDQVKPEQLDFLRSIGFTFETKPKPAQLNRLPPVNNPLNINIQQSQSVAFEDIQTRNRVNRQEGFGSTGNFGFNRPINQIPQFQKDQRGFQNPIPQFQQFGNFQQFQQYRTIPDEHYRALQASRFQQLQQFNPVNNFQFRQPFQFQPPPVTKQLENLLLQSGVAAGDASRQEDLNIVSKVLALNHERSDSQFTGNRRFARDDRTVSENTGKGLLVGEISETPFASKYNSPK